VASLITYVLERWIKFEGPISVGTYDDNAPTFTDGAYLALELKKGIIFVRNQVTRSQMLAPGFRPFEERFAEVLSYISEIKRLCDSRNISLTIVLIPDEMQVSEPLQTRVVAMSGLAPASFDFTLPNKLLHASFEELKIDYLDLTTEFSNHSINDRLYRPNDSHWNIAGNALAARLIFQHVSPQLGPVKK
jgi:hypothetical protein